MKHLIVAVIETEGDKEPHTVQLHGDFHAVKVHVKRRMGWSMHCTDADLDETIQLFFGVNNMLKLLRDVAAAVKSEFSYSRGVIQRYLDKLAESRQELHVGLKCDKEEMEHREKEQSTKAISADGTGLVAPAVGRVRDGQGTGDESL